MSSMMSSISLSDRFSITAWPHFTSISSFTILILHLSFGLTGWYTIWATSEGTSSEMSSFPVKSKIFLRLEPVVDRQSLLIVCNKIFGKIFFEFSIWDTNPRNRLMRVNFDCLVSASSSKKYQCVWSGSSNINWIDLLSQPNSTSTWVGAWLNNG